MGQPTKRRMTAAQRAWCKEYESWTGFPPTMTEFHNGSLSFSEAANAQVVWYDEHASDGVRRLGNSIPRDEEAAA